MEKHEHGHGSHDHESHDHGHAHTHNVKVSKIDRVSPTQVKLSIELPQDVVRSHEASTVQRYMNAAKIPGFRPGKAPVKMVRERYKEEIMKDLVSHLLESALAEALETTKLNPISRPKIQLKDVSLEGDKPFAFEAEFEVQPEIEIRKYKGIPLKAKKFDVVEEEVTKTLDSLRDRMSVLEPSTLTKPEKGIYAVVEIGYEIKKVPPKIEEPRAYTLELGTESIIPEIDTALMTMSVGEQKEVTVKFPKDHDDKEVAGYDAVYTCKILELKKKNLPELNDAFASQLKEGNTLEALTAEIRDTISENKKQETENAQRREVLEYVVKNNKFDVAQSLIEQQMARLYGYMQEDFKKRGATPPELKPQDVESLKKRAEEMVRGSLVLKEISVKENIQLDEKLVDDRIEGLAKQMNRSTEETKKWLEGRGMLDRLKDEVLTDQVYSFLIRNAEIGETN